MSLLQLREGSKSYPEQQIFQNISLQIQKQDRIGLIGANGMGKSTLIKIFTGDKYLDEGEVLCSNDLEIGYLEQDLGLDGEVTLYQEMLRVYQDLFELEEKLRKLEAKMESASGTELDKVLKKYSRLREKFEEEEGYRYESKIEGVLRGLGFVEADFERELENFSGGQKTRAALAKLLLQEPNLLLLDEPTNHLDLAAKEWLEDYLHDYPGAVVIISHDRYLLENLVDRIWELEKGRLEKYRGNYSFYLEEREQRLLRWQREYEQQQKKIKEMKAFIRKYKAGIKSKQARGRQKKLDRMDKIPPPPTLEKPTIEFQYKPNTIEEVLTVENLSKSYENEQIFSDLEFKLYRGTKAALVGPNGSGKTTLLEIINGLKEADSGQVRTAKGIKIAYYDQEHRNLSFDYNLVEELQKVKSLSEGQARDVLAKFLFTGDEVFKSVSTLSGGEKARLSLAKLSLQNCNLLLMDEPTNHLDIDSKELLQSSLENYPGTILIISHDRYLLDKLVDKVFALEDTKLVEYEGDYSYYRKEYEKKVAQQKQQEKAKKKEQFQEQNKKKSEETESIAREEVEEKIIELETKLEKVEEKLNTSDVEQEELVELTEEYQEIQHKLEEYYQLWEEAI
ncbi:ABC-F family ATP-binding cassette domain-containing protein [Halanaerobacter jeridensis]|uniref:ATP-binding cassette subfamily F protein 3 n=1 Tax=Halanaerobacter jeridensis TaxID=706427 RepID=A0A938XSU6_9FIRM|nr:ABC-F family ATP-binding cassette domain-containing protein [Halanaerobacter jeridensis]MBM7557086.1 ATP-binding cassette subfamily F protein 3 [Halanaerobacter jeridensis]